MIPLLGHNGRNSRWMVGGCIVLAVIVFFAFELNQYLGLEYLQSRLVAMHRFYVAKPVETVILYFVMYVVLTGVSLPGAVAMTLAGGALFGLLGGTLIVSFASTLGATVAFVFSRFVLRNFITERLGNHLGVVNRGIEREGALYLFALRMVPVIPYFAINLAMGVTSINVVKFAFVSQLGMLAGTLVFVNAGTQLAAIESVQDIISAPLIASFCLIGVFPFVARRIVSALSRRRALRGYPRPSYFDRDVIVVGAGPAGLVSAMLASALRAKVTLVERSRMGGDCLNTGCVPSKALIRSAKFLAQVERSTQLGVRHASAEFTFGDIMRRVRGVIAKIEPNDSIERYESLGVECISGEASVVSPYSVRVGDRTLTSRKIIVASGSSPLVPPIPGIENIPYVTSETVWGLESLPSRLLVLGGGPLGCELAQSFARLRVKVTQVEMMSRLLPHEDEDVTSRVRAVLEEDGVQVLEEHQAMEFGPGPTLRCVCGATGKEVSIAFDLLLIAAGRQANGRGLGLELLDVEVHPNGTVETNEFMQTGVPTIYACGDVVGPLQFTHLASHQAWYATVNAIFGGFWNFRVNYSGIPYATFTEPEVARVGLNEQEAVAQGVEYEVTKCSFGELDRAVADSNASGELKVLTRKGDDRILGATIVGEHAGELIAEYALAMRHGLGLNKILRTVHAYPTMMEINKLAAGRWRRRHAPERFLRWLERYNRWRRGG